MNVKLINNPASWHSSVTEQRVLEAADRQKHDLDDPGICIACGHEQDGCEPDTREYECENCGSLTVYGAEELLIHLL